MTHFAGASDDTGGTGPDCAQPARRGFARWPDRLRGLRRDGSSNGTTTLSGGRAAILFAPLLLAGCSLAPSYVQPPLPTPAAYPDAPPTGPSIARVGWRDFFRDEQLRALIADALDNNRDIRMAAARVAQARAGWRIEGAALYPDINAVGTGSRGRSFFNLPGAGPLRPEIKQVTAQLSAGWELDLWGRLRNMRESARNQYLATEEARRGVATGIVAQVAIGYLLEREYDERLALAQQTIATRQDSLRIMRRRYEVGSGSKLEMTQAQTLLAQAQNVVEILVQDRDVNRNALTLLVGRSVDLAPGSLDALETGQDMAVPAGLPSELLVYRPDVIAAEYQLRAVHADIGAARAAFLPRIQLTGAFGSTSPDLESLFGADSRSWNFTPTISLPLFNAGRLAANLDLAKARRIEAVAVYEKAVQTAFRDVSDALVRRRQLARQIKITRDVYDALRERARLAQLRFDNGRSAYLEVLDAQRDLFETEQALVQLRRAHLASSVALYAALGGGFVPDVAVPPDSNQQPGGKK